MSLNASPLNLRQVRYQGSVETSFKPGPLPTGGGSVETVARSKEFGTEEDQSPVNHLFKVRSRMHEFGDSTSGSNEQIDLKSGKLGEIYKKTIHAIDEHKDVITQEYKAMKRHLDLERGNKRSEIRLARKEKRSKRHVEQLEKSEYSMKKDHMNQLHETLMKHHFSLGNVEEECMQVLREESLDYIALLNKQEVAIWKRTCQDLHDTLELPIKGFTLKSKCRLIDDISAELREILSDGISQLTDLLASSCILVTDGSRSTKFKAIQHLLDLERELDEHLTNKKKVLVKGWYGFGEAVREDLNKYTQLLKFQHKHRLNTITDICARKLKEVQESAAKRHGKLMQKVAREQELLDKERAEMKAKHGERKIKSKNSHNNNLSSKPSMQGPFNMTAGGGMPGFPGVAGMGGYGGMPGGFPGMGGGGMNFNMSNAVDQLSSSPMSKTDSELHPGESQRQSICQQIDRCHGDADNAHDNLQHKSQTILMSSCASCNPEPDIPLLATTATDFTPVLLSDIIPILSSAAALLAQLPSQRPEETESCTKDPGACLVALCEQQPWRTSDASPQLSKNVLKSLRSVSKRELIQKYLQNHDTFATSGGDVEGANPDSRIQSVAYSLLSSDPNRNMNAESSESTGSSDEESGTETTTTSGTTKSGSMASRLMGKLRGSKSGAKSSKSETSRSESTSRSQPNPTSKKDNGSKAHMKPEKPADYQEFIANDHDKARKKKWSPLGLCSCCTLESFVAWCCPCLKSRYQDFKEKRAEQKERKQMQRQVLLRLRNEKANRED